MSILTSNNENEQQKTNEDESKYVLKIKHRKTQDDIDHKSELCDFLAGIIINEKNISFNVEIGIHNNEPNEKSV